MLAGIFSFLTGIGLLLFGVQFMGSSMEKLLGANFRKKINKFAGNRFSSFGLGTVITFVLQSSTASTAMFVGFAGAGIITLFQGINLIIGCNVGTAISSFLLAFESINIVEIIASFALVGFIVNLFAKDNVTVKNIGNTLIGFGILFGGLVLISNGTSVFKAIEGFDSFILSFSNPFLLIIVGIVITAILQSSFGAFAIIISLMATSGANGFSLLSACYLVYGINIGTCITTVIAGYSTNTDGKRVAWFHAIFNILGTIIFSLLTAFTPWVEWFASIVTIPSLQVLLVNLIFNVVMAIICLPLASPLTKLTKLVVRRSKKEIESAYTIRTSELSTPTIALKKLNYGMKKLFEEFTSAFEKLDSYMFNDTKNPKMLKQSLLILRKNADKVASNSLKLSSNSSFQSPKDAKDIIFVQKSVEKIKLILDDIDRIIPQMLLEDKKLVFSKTRQYTLTEAFEKINLILSKLSEIYENFYNENVEYDCAKTSSEIIDISEEITFLKTNDKRQTVKYMTMVDTPMYNNFLSIMNEIADIKNVLIDISMSAINFFEIENEKLEIETTKVGE